MQLSAQFKLEKETKGTFRYAEETTGQPPKIGTHQCHRVTSALNTSGGGAVWYPPLDALSAPQRSSETLRLACKIAPICLIPLTEDMCNRI